MASRIDHDLLDKFLGHLLDAYKNGETTRDDAIGDIAHLAAALDLGPGAGDDPNAYMKAILSGDDE